jgi:serine protease Do
VVERSGHIVTNEHVVRGAAILRVQLQDGRELGACVLGADEAADVALLKVEPRAPLPVLPLADSDRVREGEPAIVIGSPFGFSHSVTAGIVSAKERVLDRRAVPPPAAPDEARPHSFFLQTDAAINLGNSGGPVLDARGAVIGIASAYWGGPQVAQGVGFAIPVNIVKTILPRLRAEGAAPRSELGVRSQPLTPELADALAIPLAQGALLAYVEPGSAAAAAGLAVGDVVTSWAGHPVVTMEDFRIFGQLTAPGTRVRLTVQRAGARLPLALTTRAASARPRTPHPAACGGPTTTPAEDLEVVAVTPARAAGLPDHAGVEVTRVRAASRGGDLVEGDLLLRAGALPLRTADDLRRALRDAPRGRPLPLLVRREGEDFWTTLTPK